MCKGETLVILKLDSLLYLLDIWRWYSVSTDKQPKNKQLIHRFPPGMSGNPAGRPKKVKCIPDILQKIGKTKIKDNPFITDAAKQKFAALGNVSQLDALMQLVYSLALSGVPWAVHFIAERTEGPPKQRIEIEQTTIHIDIEGLQIEEPDQIDNPISDSDHGELIS